MMKVSGHICIAINDIMSLQLAEENNFGLFMYVDSNSTNLEVKFDWIHGIETTEQLIKLTKGNELDV